MLATVLEELEQVLVLGAWEGGEPSRRSPLDPSWRDGPTRPSSSRLKGSVPPHRSTRPVVLVLSNDYRFGWFEDARGRTPAGACGRSSTSGSLTADPMRVAEV